MERKIYEAPIYFEKNRVFRVYKGGALFDSFIGDGSCDGDFPEEWLSSAVTAINVPPHGEREGVSVIKGTGEYFDDVISRYKTEMLGEGSTGKLDVLVKYLDSAIRLPVQAHPDKAFAKQHFGSPHGKEESWLVLATRPDACVYFGFKDGVTREEFERAIDLTENKGDDTIVSLMRRYGVSPGDVIYIPANTVHAIGAGCLMLEVQEPTDFTLQPERYCGDYKLSDREMYIGLDRKTALDCFSYGKQPEAKLMPRVISDCGGVRYEELIGKAQTDSFCLRRARLDGKNSIFSADKSACVYAVTAGKGEIFAEGYSKPLCTGDYFFMPSAAAKSGSFAFRTESGMEIAECYAEA